MVVKIILTLLVSGVIGYGTNYIAVKMLFRPLKPVYIFGHRLPFTPGIIPKGQPRLARALGNAVSDSLLTQSDLEKALTSDETVSAVTGKVCSSLYMRPDPTVGGTLREFAGGCAYEGAKTRLTEHLCQKVQEGIKSANIGEIIISEGVSAIKASLSGTMMAMFVTDELIQSVAAPVADKIDEYIDEKAPEKIRETVERELLSIEGKTIPEVFTDLDINEEKLSRAVGKIYRGLAENVVNTVLSSMKISEIVEAKVNAMPVEDLEELVMSVMKKELNSVVNLGALIGVIIGILNVLINL